MLINIWNEIIVFVRDQTVKKKYYGKYYILYRDLGVNLNAEKAFGEVRKAEDKLEEWTWKWVWEGGIDYEDDRKVWGEGAVEEDR